MTTQMLENAGFHDVIAEDRTEQVISLSECPLVVEQFILFLYNTVQYKLKNAYKGMDFFLSLEKAWYT